MRIKLVDVYKAVLALRNFNSKMPATIAYKFGRLKTILETSYKEIEKQKNELIIKYGEKKENDDYQILPDFKNWKIFVDEYNALLQEEIDIQIESMITQMDLEKIDSTIDFIEAIQFCIIKA